jgi:phosphatidate cytidylyltransferase
MVRLLSGIVLGGAALAAILFLPIAALRVLACVVAALAAYEYLRIAGADSSAMLLVVILCWFVSGGGGLSVEMVLLVAFAWVAGMVLFAGRTIQQAAAGVFAPVYIGLPMGMLVAVHAAGGRAATLLLVATVVVSDSLQYYSGRMFGRHPLAPTISPKKTIEGAIGGAIAGTMFMTFAGRWVFAGSGPLSLALLGVAVVALGICGDLFESRLKRVSGIKDSAALIPGHGGMLDRIDALLFATPAFYVYLRSMA